MGMKEQETSSASP